MKVQVIALIGDWPSSDAAHMLSVLHADSAPEEMYCHIGLVTRTPALAASAIRRSGSSMRRCSGVSLQTLASFLSTNTECRKNLFEMEVTSLLHCFHTIASFEALTLVLDVIEAAFSSFAREQAKHRGAGIPLLVISQVDGEKAVCPYTGCGRGRGEAVKPSSSQETLKLHRRSTQS